MKWRSESVQECVARISQWHRWFAWYPVRIGSEIYWLETVERRRDWHYDGGFWLHRKAHFEGLLP